MLFSTFRNMPKLSALQPWLFRFSYVLFFKRESYYVSLAGLRLTEIFLLQPLKCWFQRCVLQCAASISISKWGGGKGYIWRITILFPMCLQQTALSSVYTYNPQSSHIYDLRRKHIDFSFTTKAFRFKYSHFCVLKTFIFSF